MNDATIIGLAHGAPILIASALTTRSEGATTIAMGAMFAIAYRVFHRPPPDVLDERVGS
jgi:hypothetical protein